MEQLQIVCFLTTSQNYRIIGLLRYSRVQGALDGGCSVGDPGPLDAVRGHALRGHRGGVRLVGQRVHNQAEAGLVKTCPVTPQLRTYLYGTRPRG